MERQGSALESDYFLPNSKITELITNITKMSKNATIESDLSQVLDEFLDKLGECDKYLQNGIFNMNFAEAALLLQSSTDLYSKKVDLLWDIIFDYQKRMLLSEEQNGDKQQELEKVEERKRKYKRKRKTNSDGSETAKLVDNFSFGPAENFDYLSQHYDTVDLSKEWSKFEPKKQTENDDLREHITNKKCLFLPNNQLYTENNDYVGRYDQFHSTSLVDEIFHLDEQRLIADDHNCVSKMRIDSYVINDFLLENAIPTTASKDKYITDLNKYINNFLELHKYSNKVAPTSDDTRERLYCKKSAVCLERLSPKEIREKIRRTSLADSLFGDDNMSTVSGHCSSPCNSLKKACGVTETYDQISGSLENRSKSCSQDSAFYEDGEDQVNNEENVIVGDIPVDGATITDVEDITSARDGVSDKTENASSTLEDISSTNIKSTEVALSAATNTDSSLESVTEDVPITTNVSDDNLESSIEIKTKEVANTYEVVGRRTTGRKIERKVFEDFVCDEPEQEEQEEQEPEIKKRKVQRRKVSEKVLRNLATGVTAKYRDFEIFFKMNYKTAEGEGVIPTLESDSENSDEGEEFEHMSDEEEEREKENEESASPINLEEETSDLEQSREEATPEMSKNDPCEDQGMSVSEPTDALDLSAVINPAISPIPDLTLPSCSKSKDAELRTSTPYNSRLAEKNLAFSDVDLEQEELCRKNVREWRAFIMPKIAKMENKSDFDIHEYGSRIIESSEVGEERHFKDVVQGKNAAEVARYFIATLQLANTNNVEITGAVSGKLANDDFKIKTLDKTKHHELLEDYQAPSEETFRERLERVKALNPKVPLRSIPNRISLAKKTRFSVLSIKKR